MQPLQYAITCAATCRATLRSVSASNRPKLFRTRINCTVQEEREKKKLMTIRPHCWCCSPCSSRFIMFFYEHELEATSSKKKIPNTPEWEAIKWQMRRPPPPPFGWHASSHAETRQICDLQPHFSKGVSAFVNRVRLLALTAERTSCRRMLYGKQPIVHYLW